MPRVASVYSRQVQLFVVFSGKWKLDTAKNALFSACQSGGRVDVGVHAFTVSLFDLLSVGSRVGGSSGAPFPYHASAYSPSSQASRW